MKERLLEIFAELLSFEVSTITEKWDRANELLAELIDLSINFNPADCSQEDLELISVKAREAYQHMDKLEEEFIKQQ